MMQPNSQWRGDPTFLPELLRMWGVTVNEMDGWRDRGEGDFTDIWGVVAHHTAGANTSAQYIAVNPGIENALSSQIHLDRNGVATLCGAGIAYHAGEATWPPAMTGYTTRPSAGGSRSYTTANARMIGIEAVNMGDGSQPWPDVQMDAYRRICAAICWFLGHNADRVLGHKEIAPSRKIDPNFNMNAFRDQVQRLIDNPPFNPNKELADVANEINDIHHELTYRFRSRYKDAAGNQSTYTDTIAGYILEMDRKLEELHAVQLPAINSKLAIIAKALDVKLDKQ